MTDQLRSQPSSGHDEAQGYAASLREMGAFYYVDFDELRAAADFIERQAARIVELETVIRGLMRVQPSERKGAILKEYQAARDAMKGAA